MTKLSSIYHERIRPGIVAFVHKYIPVDDPDKGGPEFPPIVGTGFVVQPDGVIATNAHVVRAFMRLPRPKDAEDWPVKAILFHLTDAGMVEIPLEVLGVAQIGAFEGGATYYGPKKGPDLAFVHVKARGLPTLSLDANTRIEEGMNVCTAGYPMGTDALTAPGWMHQITPTLQAGIVSAVMPFVCPTPHCYSINVMTQGGASGSPVFLADTGGVVGVLYAGLHDIDITPDKKMLYRVPTAISYVVPAHYIEKCLASFPMHEFDQPKDAQTIPEMLKGARIANILEEGRGWSIKEVGPEPKIREAAHFKPKPSK